MSDELFAYKITPEGNGFKLVLSVMPSPEGPAKKHEIFLHHDTAVDIANTLQGILRGDDPVLQ